MPSTSYLLHRYVSVAMNGKSIIIILVGKHTSILYLYPKQIDNLVLEYVFHHR